MNLYQNILLAIDFSEHGHYVAQKARQFADQFSAQLHIIHVLDNIPMPDTPYGTVIPLQEDSAYDLLEIKKNKFIQLADQLSIALTRRGLVWGAPQEEITRLAVQEHIDLIIVGSHELHGLGVLMGSTAKDVLYHANCDVLAIHIKN